MATALMSKVLTLSEETRTEQYAIHGVCHGHEFYMSSSLLNAVTLFRDAAFREVRLTEERQKEIFIGSSCNTSDGSRLFEDDDLGGLDELRLMNAIISICIDTMESIDLPLPPLPDEVRQDAYAEAA